MEQHERNELYNLELQDTLTPAQQARKEVLKALAREDDALEKIKTAQGQPQALHKITDAAAPDFPAAMPRAGQKPVAPAPGTSPPVAQTVIDGSGQVLDGRAAVLQLELNQLEQAIKYAGDHNEGSGLDVPAMKAKAQELRAMIATIKSQANPLVYQPGQSPDVHSTPLRP